MTMQDAIFAGRKLTYSRVITRDDIVRFAQLSGDFGEHHVVPDASGRLVAHGLLVLTVPTRMGTDLHYLAHTMQWMFVRPVYDGDTVTADIVLSSVQLIEDAKGKRLDIAMIVKVSNQDGRLVVRGESTGVVVHPPTVAQYRAMEG
jgi:acyl dehydratase